MTFASSKTAEMLGFGAAVEKPGHPATFGTKSGDGSTTTKTVPNREKTLYRAEFLAQMPPAIHSFAAQRLAGAKLRSMMLQRDSGALAGGA